MNPDKKKITGKKIEKLDYLEIYIRENGQLILTPLSENCISVFKAISENQQDIPNLYCG
jgi:predicted RNA-binding protein